jgi:outer membrane protein OmpA-like peptidoglycan-associated protein
MPGLKACRGPFAAVALVLALETPVVHGQQQVQVVVTAVPNPVPAGTCTGIWVEVRDQLNQRLFKLADGTALHSRSYDYSQPNAMDFAWKDNDPSNGYLCARAGAGAVSTQVTATIRGTPYSGATVVAIESPNAAPAAVASAAGASPANPQPQPAAPAPAAGAAAAGAAQPPGAAPSGYGQPPAAGTQPTGYEQQPGAAGAPNAQAQPSGAAAGAPPAPAPGQPYVPPAAAPASAAAGQPTSGQTPPPTDPSQAYAAPATPSTAANAGAPAPAAPAAAPAPAATQAEAEPEVKSVGGLFKKIGKHLKKKTSQVATQTAQNLATTATGVIDTTLETGTGLVSNTVAEAGNKARMGIGGVGKKLLPFGQPGGASSDNLITAVASGRAVLRMMRFTGTTASLEPSSRELVQRLAEALKATPGTFLIEAHVDPLESPAASQQLSERRAGEVKRALISQGIEPVRLIALGYGATRSSPEVPPEGGQPISARIEIAKTQ